MGNKTLMNDNVVTAVVKKKGQKQDYMSFSQPHMHCTSHISSLLCIISGTYVHVHVGLHVCKKYLAIPTLLLISLKCSYYLIVCYKYSYI